MTKIYIVIPTYNEARNIGKLIEAILSLPGNEFNILVVDDNSPDGTGQLVETIKQRYSQVDVLHRQQKAGLGRAYVAGFKEVLARGADYIIQMDADWSHDPKYLPALLGIVKQADVAVGSRYIQGGGSSGWPLRRRLISAFGNTYARLILGLPLRDLTGGFRCYRRAVLETIGLDSLDSIGYCFQIETIYQTYRHGFKITETPIIFVNRASGSSKLSVNIFIESFWKVLRLRFKS